MKLLLYVLLAATLACVAPGAFAAPQNRDEAVADLENVAAERRAEAVAWLAGQGGMADQPLLLKRLRDEHPLVRHQAEQGLWLLWSRSGDAAIDRLMLAGIEHMQAGDLPRAIAAFSEVIRRQPAFAEGWNKRATAYFLAGDFRRSLADCDEVMKRNPEHFGALSGYGQIYFELEEFDRAIEYWRRALEVNPNMDGVGRNIDAVEQLLKKKKGLSNA